jgi:hypothetical protein
MSFEVTLMYKHDLPHFFRLLLLSLVIILAIVDVVGVWWYPPADLFGMGFDSDFSSRHPDLEGILILSGWFGIGGLAMTVKEKKDWQWLISKLVRWPEERELHNRANQGDAEAQYELGLLYSLPFGCGMNDMARAAFWYRKADDQGHTEAQYSLAHMYDENGNHYYGQSSPAQAKQKQSALYTFLSERQYPKLSDEERKASLEAFDQTKDDLQPSNSDEVSGGDQPSGN